MTVFKDSFPSLNDKLIAIIQTDLWDEGGKYPRGFFRKDIKKYCLDKKKVRDALNNADMDFITRGRLMKELGL
jgi:hypothetical protein